MRTITTLGLSLTSILLQAQWIAIDPGINTEFEAVHVDDAESYWVGAPNGLLLQTGDGGLEWSTSVVIGAGDLGGVHRIDASRLLMLADDGMVARSDDNGATWTLINTGAPNVLYDITGIGDLIWASGRDGGLVHSTDGGLTWSLQTSGTNVRLHGIAALDANTLVSVGRNGVVLRTTNGGTTWTSSTQAGGEDLVAISFLDDAQRTGLIGGAPGELLRSTDQGLTWSAITVPTQLEVAAFAHQDPDLVVAVGDGGLIMTSSDQGASWQVMTSPVTAELTDVDMKDSVAVAVGLNGSVLKWDMRTLGPQNVEENTVPTHLTIYPNPSTGPVTIELNESIKSESLWIEILRNDGRLVDRAEWPAGRRKAHIEELDPGVYVIRVGTPGGKSVRRTLVVTGR